MNAPRISSLLALLAVLAGAAGCGVDKMPLGPSGSARVWGTVTDRATGAPLAGVRLWSPPAAAATTDQAGRYSMTVQWQYGNPTLDAGHGCMVSLVVTREGYSATYPAVTCRNGASYEENIPLDAVR